MTCIRCYITVPVRCSAYNYDSYCKCGRSWKTRENLHICTSMYVFTKHNDLACANDQHLHTKYGKLSSLCYKYPLMFVCCKLVRRILTTLIHYKLRLLLSENLIFVPLLTSCIISFKESTTEYQWYGCPIRMHRSIMFCTFMMKPNTWQTAPNMQWINLMILR